jgi:hypothetical protein
MGQGTSEHHLIEQPVQHDKTIEQKQFQQSHIPMGQGALMEMQQQMHQPNLQTQLVEQIRERARLLECHVQQQNTQQEQEQWQQTVMRQRTSEDQLLEQPVQQDEIIEQELQQHPQIPVGQGALLDFFEPASQRLPPPGPQETTDDYYEDEESRSYQSKEDA